MRRTHAPHMQRVAGGWGAWRRSLGLRRGGPPGRGTHPDQPAARGGMLAGRVGRAPAPVQGVPGGGGRAEAGATSTLPQLRRADRGGFASSTGRSAGPPASWPTAYTRCSWGQPACEAPQRSLSRFEDWRLQATHIAVWQLRQVDLGPWRALRSERRLPAMSLGAGPGGPPLVALTGSSFVRQHGGQRQNTLARDPGERRSDGLSPAARRALQASRTLAAACARGNVHAGDAGR